MTWTDTQAQHGRNTYMIVAQNAYGRSEVLMDTIYVGRDLPVYVQNMEAKGSADNNDAVLTWDAPTVGVNGGVIIDKELSYNVYSYNVETKALTLIKSGIKDHTYTVVNEPLEEQDTYAYAVSAVNTEGESQAYARQVILGPLYTLPYKESFPAKETTTKPWNVITENSYALTWGVTNPDGSTYNGATAQARLERMHKCGDLSRKEQTWLNAAQFERLNRGDCACAAGEDAPVWRALYAAWLRSWLRPVVRVDYDREAFSYTPGNVRVTFDNNLRAARPGADPPAPGTGPPG